MAYEFRLPDIGEGLREATIVKWYVSVGDVIKADEDIVEVQTDKAVVEISTPVGGTIISLGGEVDETINVGDVLLTIDDGKEKSPIQTDEREEKTSPSTPVHMAKKEPRTRVIAAPAVRRLAREMDIDITKVTATGKGGRVIRDDLYAYASAQKEPAVQTPPVVQTESSIAGKREPIRGLRRSIYENMTRVKNIVPQCTAMDEIDVSSLVAIREKLRDYAENKQIKLTYLPFIVKAVAHALKQYPIFNATIDEEQMEIVYNGEINIGIATATPDGLVVPVIKQVGEKSILQIAAEIDELATKGRNRKLTPTDLSGGTFTISNTGNKGGIFATPIINYPEVAILGVHNIKKKPVVQNDEIVIGQLMGISLTFDHRIIDGEPTGFFMTEIKDLLENPEQLLVEGR